MEVHLAPLWQAYGGLRFNMYKTFDFRYADLIFVSRVSYLVSRQLRPAKPALILIDPSAALRVTGHTKDSILALHILLVRRCNIFTRLARYSNCFFVIL